MSYCQKQVSAIAMRQHRRLSEQGPFLPTMNRTGLTQGIEAAATQALAAKGYISAVDLHMRMGRLTKTNYERWRMRQTRNLEAVLTGKLSQHQFLLPIRRALARDELNLEPSYTVFMSWGKWAQQAAPIHQIRQFPHRAVVLDALPQPQTYGSQTKASE